MGAPLSTAAVAVDEEVRISLMIHNPSGKEVALTKQPWKKRQKIPDAHA